MTCYDYSEQEVEALKAKLVTARELVEYAYDLIGGNWPEADEFLDSTADMSKATP
jgi:hypothetical protein